MPSFKVYKHIAHGIQAVKQGWSWPAFLFDWIWACSNRLWQFSFGILFLILVIHFVIASNIPDECRYGLIFFSRSFNYGEGCTAIYVRAAFVEGILLLALKLGVGMIGNSEKQFILARRGFKLLGEVSANSADHAIAMVSKNLE